MGSLGRLSLVGSLGRRSLGRWRQVNGFLISQLGLLGKFQASERPRQVPVFWKQWAYALLLLLLSNIPGMPG